MARKLKENYVSFIILLFLAMKNNHHGILIKSIVTSVPIFVLNYPKYQFSNRQYTKGNFPSIHISFHAHFAQIQRVNQ